jgi:hypothetical protein
VLGLALGRAVIGTLGWKKIFLINLPIGRGAVPEPDKRPDPAWPGVCLTGWGLSDVKPAASRGRWDCSGVVPPIRGVGYEPQGKR